MIILGAGMAGCLLGTLNGGAHIYEASDELPDTHRAVLRFREDKISRATGIPFKKVKVYKSIFYGGGHWPLDIRFMNMYSKKVTNKYLARSITNLDTVERFIAPGDFHYMLADMCHGRIHFNHKATAIGIHGIVFNDEFELERGVKEIEPIVSTIPMNILSYLTGEEIKGIKFDHMPVLVTRHKVTDCDLYQTIYYPDEQTPVYRATLTGEDLIIESVGDVSTDDFAMVLKSFGFDNSDTEVFPVDQGKTIQQYGKISPIDDNVRRDFMLRMTMKYHVYSAGRFATWKNILLDDVYDDMFKIRAMIESDPYQVYKVSRL